MTRSSLPLRFHVLLALLIFSACALLVVSAGAAPSVRIMPPDGSTFAVGQFFDLRVEASGIPAGDAQLSVALNGTPLESIEGLTVQRTSTAAGRMEATVRRLSFPNPMEGKITAQLQTADGVVTAESRFTVLEVRGGAPRAKNVILMIGDGMGVAHRTAARVISRGIRFGRYNGKLEMEDMEAHGFSFTPSLNALVTDSANGATVMAGGNKVDNGSLCVWPDNTSDTVDNPRFENIFDYVRRTRGMATGVVTTASVADATPAAFLAYCYKRDDTAKIVAQYPQSSPEVLFGGGRNDVSKTVRDKFTAAGYAYVTTADELRALPLDTKRCLGLFSASTMATYVDRAEALRRGSGTGLTEPSLVEMTEAALRILSQYPNGFVLMVEGASIDKQSHSTDATRAIWETIEFDRAVGVAKRFAQQRGDTLVVVLADHETGGLTVTGFGGSPPKLQLNWTSTPALAGEGMLEPPYVAPRSGSTDHTGEDVPVSASGPGAAQFTACMDGTEIFFGILRALEGGYTYKPAAQPGDVNGDGKVNLADVTLLLRAVVGIKSQ